MEQTRRQGYALDDGNYIAGVQVLAAPVIGQSRGVTHALIAIGIAGAIQRAGTEALGQALVDVAAAIAEQMPAV